MALQCPFCPYTEFDSYAVIKHVECCHPETGESPFVVSQDEELSRSDVGYNEKLAFNFSEHPSQDDEYFECDCGEVVLLLDINSHFALHEFEEAFVSENASSAILQRNEISSMDDAQLDLISPADDGTFPLKPASLKVSKQRSRGAHHKSHYGHHGVKDFVDVMMASKSSRSRAQKTIARDDKPRRLGKSELGPYAHEDQMPSSLLKQLEIGAPTTLANKIDHNGKLIRVESTANEIRHIIPVLAQLCEQDRTVSKAYLCQPDVRHVVKMNKEGGFCGYRNIQMMISYIQDTKSPGHQHFPGKLPSILQLQDAIECAWDKGINAAGRVETGGIKGTRKYIGTPEAQALFVSWNIGYSSTHRLGLGHQINITCSCETSAYSDTAESKVFRKVLDSVEEYFIHGADNPSRKVSRTSLPPLYFQHPGHSLTIVGLEERKNGSLGLLVLDPMFKPSPAILSLIGTQFNSTAPEKLLKAYRRGETYLSRYPNFEILSACARRLEDMVKY